MESKFLDPENPSGKTTLQECQKKSWRIAWATWRAISCWPGYLMLANNSWDKAVLQRCMTPHRTIPQPVKKEQDMIHQKNRKTRNISCHWRFLMLEMHFGLLCWTAKQQLNAEDQEYRHTCRVVHGREVRPDDHQWCRPTYIWFDNKSVWTATKVPQLESDPKRNRAALLLVMSMKKKIDFSGVKVKGWSMLICGRKLDKIMKR